MHIVKCKCNYSRILGCDPQCVTNPNNPSFQNRLKLSKQLNPHFLVENAGIVARVNSCCSPGIRDGRKRGVEEQKITER